LSFTFSFALLRLSFLRAPAPPLVAAAPGRRRPRQHQTDGKLPLHVDAQAGAWAKHRGAGSTSALRRSGTGHSIGVREACSAKDTERCRIVGAVEAARSAPLAGAAVAAARHGQEAAEQGAVDVVDHGLRSGCPPCSPFFRRERARRLLSTLIRVGDALACSSGAVPLVPQAQLLRCRIH